MLIPFPYAAGEHQTKNAHEFARQGFATVIEDAALAVQDPVMEASNLILSGKAARMRDAMRQINLKRSPAVDIIANDIVNLVTMATGPGAEREIRPVDNQTR